MSIQHQSWYHGAIDRIKSEAVLYGRRPGLFLVRDSQTSPGDYVLSVSENTKVSHYIVSRRGNQFLIGDQSFSDLPAVIEFYRTHYLDTTTLIEIAPQQPPGPVLNNRASNSFVQPVTPTLPPPVDIQGKVVCRGKFDFKSDDPEDLNFRKGDMMTVLRKDEDDWWYARHSDGRTGSIPVPYVEVVEDSQGEAQKVQRARAIMDRQCPYDPSALSFKAGDVIHVTKQNDNGLWEGELSGRTGHFPFTHVEVLPS